MMNLSDGLLRLGVPMRALLTALLLLFPALALAGPNTVAVLYFTNDGNPELTPLKVGLADMMITDLHGAQPMKIVERAQLQSILDELDLGHSGIVDPDTAAKVGKLLGAEWMIMGSYFDLLGDLLMNGKLVRVETSEIVFSEKVTGKTKEFMALEEQLAGMMARELQTRAGAPTQEAPAPAEPVPTSAEPTPAGHRQRSGDPAPAPPAVVSEDVDTLAAAVSFSEGLIYMDKKDVARARDSFEQAVKLDPALTDAQTQLASLAL